MHTLRDRVLLACSAVHGGTGVQAKPRPCASHDRRAWFRGSAPGRECVPSKVKMDGPDLGQRRAVSPFVGRSETAPLLSVPSMQGKFCHTKFFQERKRADTGTGATQNPCTCVYDVSLISDLSREYAKRDHRFASLVARARYRLAAASTVACTVYGCVQAVAMRALSALSIAPAATGREDQRRGSHGAIGGARRLR
ncbi:hypothetical protein HPB51_005343 [Rhipicephalus microplus]|uniref:Uncharacterized protein n=1 Tax=Rhipicephalus microplus TaxID=6941 RepID=A0A9J6EY13_RHIMP|nr:hypothetical protein HPB51_005343 [Rhipicephalus microplus]